MRKGVSFALSREPRYEVVAEAADIAGALEAIRIWQPAIIVLDLVLGGRDGLEGIAVLRSALPAVRIVVFSSSSEEIFGPLALERGADGYVSKGTSPEELLAAMACVLGGGRYLRKGLSGSNEALRGSIFRDLSGRELQVFLRLGEGKTPSEIAHELHLSVKTVFAHRENLKTKLHVTSSAELVRRATVYHVLGPNAPGGATPQNENLS